MGTHQRGNTPFSFVPLNAMADNILDFESLGKKAADLLSKGYDAGKLKVSAESSASNGVKFSADGKTKLGTDDPVEGSLKVTYKNKEKGIKVDEKWETSGKVSSTVTASDVGVDGLELALGVSYEEENNKASQSGKLTVKFANEHAAVGVVGKMVRGSKPTIDVDLTAGHAGFIAGVAAGHDGANRKPVDVKVSYVERPVQVTFSGENNFGTLGLASTTRSLRAGTPPVPCRGSVALPSPRSRLAASASATAAARSRPRSTRTPRSAAR